MPTRRHFSLRVHVGDIIAADAFPAAVVQQVDAVSVDAADLVAVAVVSVPVLAVPDAPAAVGKDYRALIRIEIDFPAAAVVDVPIAGTPLHRHIAPGIVENLFAVDAADKVAVRVGQVPCSAPFDAVVTVVEQVDLVPVEDGITVIIDIDGPAFDADRAAVSQILVIFGAELGFPRRYFVTGVFKPEVVFVRYDILRPERRSCRQQKGKE